MKGLVYCLSHDCHFDIDRNLSIVHCRSSSGDSVICCVGLLVPPWLLVIGVSRTSLMVGRVSIQSFLGIVRGHKIMLLAIFRICLPIILFYAEFTF